MKTLVLLAMFGVLSTSSDEEARQLLDRFTQDLGLPQAWPLEKHGSRMSGGVYLGNFVLEIAVWPQVEPYQLLGIGVDIPSSYEELRGRGLTIREQEREPGFFKNAMVAQLAGEGLGFFLAKGNPAWLEPHLKKARREFAESKGGKAGVSGVASVDVGMNGPRREAFEKLISPTKPEALDPPVVITERRYRINAIKIRCKDPELAKKALPDGLPVQFVQ